MTRVAYLQWWPAVVLHIEGWGEVKIQTISIHILLYHLCTQVPKFFDIIFIFIIIHDIMKINKSYMDIHVVICH